MHSTWFFVFVCLSVCLLQCLRATVQHYTGWLDLKFGKLRKRTSFERYGVKGNMQISTGLPRPDLLALRKETDFQRAGMWPWVAQPSQPSPASKCVYLYVCTLCAESLHFSAHFCRMCRQWWRGPVLGIKPSSNVILHNMHNVIPFNILKGLVSFQRKM